VTESTSIRGVTAGAHDGRRADILLLVTTTFQTLARRAAVLTFAVATSVLVASPAGAEVPDGWSDPPPVDKLHALLVLVGIPLLLFVLIAVAVYIPALIRGERITPGAPAIENQWFGGPRGGTHELESSSAPASADADDTGGASGRW
jgi:hypothetical protein